MTNRLTIHCVPPRLHPGYGPESVFTHIHAGSAPPDIPLFDPEHFHGPAPTPMSDALVDHLDAFNREIGHPLGRETVDRLRHGVHLVIAGQQPGLLLGPLYTFWKMLSTVVLARRLEALGTESVIPAFWIASEDHDIFEVNRVRVGGARYVAAPGMEPVRGRMPPVGLVSLTHHRDPLLRFLTDHLPDTPHREWLLASTAGADYSGYGRFFATLAAALLRDWPMVFVDALELRRFTAPVLAEAVAQAGAVTAAVRRGGNRVRQSDYPVPLNEAAVFEILPGDVPGRIKWEFDGTRWMTPNGQLTPDAAADRIRRYPERFSAGAALRPVLQDAILPVRVTVCGPSELLYLWQIDPVYDVVGVERSRLQPRIHATVLPSGTRRQIDVLGGLDVALAGIGADKPGDPTEDLNTISAARDALCRHIETVGDGDPILIARAVEAIRYHVSKAMGNIEKTRRERSGSRRHQQDRFDAWVFPDGRPRPQERVVGLFDILAEWGPDWVEWVCDGVSFRETAHQFIIMM